MKRKIRLAPLAALASALAAMLGAPAASAAATLVRVRQGLSPVGGAAVYQNCTFRGATDAGGELSLASVAVGDHLQVRRLVHTGPSNKGSHGGWAYHVWLTNITMEDDGTQTDHVVTNPAATQTLFVARNRAQIGLNLVASVEYNATPDNLSDIALGLERASGYLFDVSDGQMFFERINVYENKQRWNHADLQYFATQWPNADGGGPSGIADPVNHVHLPGPGFDGNNYVPGTWSTSNGFRTIGHEMGHYAFAVLDEYYKEDGSPAVCTLDVASEELGKRASIMEYQYTRSELCHDSNHNPATFHGEATGQSTWASLAANWNSGLWSWRTPMSRGVANPGPTELSCFSTVQAIVHPVPEPSCATLVLVAEQVPGVPWVDQGFDLSHGSKIIYEGVTDTFGRLPIYGAAPGDSLVVHNDGDPPKCWLDGTVEVPAECGEVNLVGHLICPGLVAATPDFFLWPLEQVVQFFIPVSNEGTHFELTVDQDGSGPQRVDLIYDPARGGYSGTYEYDPGMALRFNGRVLAQADGVQRATHFQFTGASFNSAGLPTLPQARSWNLFPADGDVTLTVDARSMPDRTGVTTSPTASQVGPPDGLVLVGGPFSVRAAERPLAPIGLSLRYDANRAPAGLESAAIYALAGGTWRRLPSVLNRHARRVSTSIDTWGTYAVFAQPN